MKLENILFTDESKKDIKIADFGIAGVCKDKTDAGTFKYMAPEVLKGDITLANPQMDIWGVGMMMFLMLYGFHPFLSKADRFSKDYDLKNLIHKIINDPLELPNPQYKDKDYELEQEDVLTSV